MRRLRFLIVLAIAAALLLPCSVVFAQQPTSDVHLRLAFRAMPNVPRRPLLCG